MAWESVALIKNDSGECKFCVLPSPDSFDGTNDVTFSAYRTDGADFGLYYGYHTAIYAQRLDGIPIITLPNSYAKMVYGNVAGSAIDLLFTYLRQSGNVYYYTAAPRLYEDIVNVTTLRTVSVGVNSDTWKFEHFWTYGLLLNKEEQKLYLVIVQSHMYWRDGRSYESNYDQVSIIYHVCTAKNLYPYFSNSIPSGGGGSNPYADGGLSGPGGGEDQNFDEVSDTIDLPALPIYGATGSGFVTAFCPTIGQINSVADYLITPNVAQVIQGLFVKLSDVIIGLHLLPFVVDATHKKNIEIKNLAFTINTGVESYYADNQYQRIPMGSVDVLKCWDNCLDYNPYTFVSIYLPFCGYFELDTDEVMGKTLTVVYDVDIITGSCVALIQVDGSVMYQFSGMCSCQIPITSVDFNQAVQSLIGLGASAAAGIKMIKGATAATEEAASVAMAPTTKATSRQIAYENYMEAKMNEQEIKEGVASRLANASVNAVISGKGNYMHAGAVSSAPGFLACRKPFLIIKRPKQSVPEDYETMRGFPSNMKATLGDLSGYTEVEDIHLNIPDATVDEILECERLLKGGVYL